MMTGCKVVTWNVNSVRSRIEHLVSFLKNEQPEIMLLQELKCVQEQFPFEAIEDLNYNVKLLGQKSYNGVAILSKSTLEDVKYDFPNNPLPEESRYIEASCNTSIGYIRVASVYVPNGGEVNSDKFKAKLLYLKYLKEYLVENIGYGENFVIGGDFNVAPEENDVYAAEELNNSTCFTMEERKLMRSLLNTGVEDLYRLKNKESGYSWWDYRAGAWQKNLGMRIDFILSSPHTTNHLSDCYVAKEYRKLEKPSDHAPVVAEFNVSQEENKI